MNLFKKKYPSLSFSENFLGGHFSIGRLTVFGDNAMHWGCTFWTKTFGYICWRLPFRSVGRWWPLYLYCSPDATPSCSTFYMGKDSYGDKMGAPIRRKMYGHNFNTRKFYESRGVVYDD